MMLTHRTARGLNIGLGVWLFISAYLWMHSVPQFNNAWIVGALMVVISGIAMAAPNLRFFNTALAVWLFISAFALSALVAATVWNSVIVSIAVFLISLVPAAPSERQLTHKTV